MMITRMYKILLGQEDIPTSVRRNPMVKGKTYTDKVMTNAINNFHNDKERWS